MAQYTMNFKRSDNVIHYFGIPEESWVAGSTLYFTAKEHIDNDDTNAKAVISKSFGDGDIVGPSSEHYKDGYKTYEMKFIPTDTQSIQFDEGETVKKYIGGFELNTNGGSNKRTTYPDGNNYIEVKVFADVKVN